MSVKLKPCPFCGEKTHIAYWHWGAGANEPYAKNCRRCGVIGPQETTQAKAIAAWNRRAKEKKNE